MAKTLSNCGMVKLLDRALYVPQIPGLNSLVLLTCSDVMTSDQLREKTNQDASERGGYFDLKKNETLIQVMQ